MRISSITIEKEIRADLQDSPMMFTCKFHCEGEGENSVSYRRNGTDMSVKEAAELLRMFAVGLERLEKH